MIKTHVVRNRYVFLGDAVTIALSAWCAYALRFGWLFYREQRNEFGLYLMLSIVTKLSVFFLFGLYRRFWRYASVWDLLAVVLANLAGIVTLGVVMVSLRLLEVFSGLPRSVFPIDLVLCVISTIAVRASVRVLGERATMRVEPPAAGQLRRVLVAGAGDAGTLCVREMQKNPRMGMVPVGFLDDDPAKLGKRIYGIPVLGPLIIDEPLVREYRVDEVIIAMPKAGGPVIRDLAESCRSVGIPSRVMPGFYELLDGRVDTSRLRRVEIVDLLRRPSTLAPSTSGQYLRGRKVLVTGAGGSIGSELCRQIAHKGPALIVLLGHGENSIFEIAAELRSRFPGVVQQPVIADIRDRLRIEQIFRAVRPDIVFHAAAYKHVPLMEDNPEEAATNNVLGTRNVVETAAAVGTSRFVLISTDKAVAPASVMGATKRLAEQIVWHVAGRAGLPYVVVRFGNVLGSRGSVVSIFKKQIEEGGPVTVTDPEARRYFMTVPEAVHLVIEAAALGRGGELFVLEMGEPMKIVDLARDMIRLSGAEQDDIPTLFIGLRPGEKLSEALWEEGAELAVTAQPNIRIVREPGNLSGQHLGEVISRIEQAVARGERARLFEVLSEYPPTTTLARNPAPRSIDQAKTGNVVPFP